MPCSSSEALAHGQHLVTVPSGYQWHLAVLLYVSKGRKPWEILQSAIIFEPKNCREPHTISICGDDEFSTDQSTKTLHLQRGIQHFRRCASRQGVHHMGRPQGLGTSGGSWGLHRGSGVSGAVPKLPLQRRLEASEATRHHTGFRCLSWGWDPDLPFPLMLTPCLFKYGPGRRSSHRANPLYF